MNLSTQIIAQQYAFRNVPLSPVRHACVFSAGDGGWVGHETWVFVADACRRRREVLFRTADGALHRWHELLFIDSAGRTPDRYLRVVLRAGEGVC